MIAQIKIPPFIVYAIYMQIDILPYTRVNNIKTLMVVYVCDSDAIQAIT